jgi:hypothetical protein
MDRESWPSGLRSRCLGWAFILPKFVIVVALGTLDVAFGGLS